MERNGQSLPVNLTTNPYFGVSYDFFLIPAEIHEKIYQLLVDLKAGISDADIVIGEKNNIRDSDRLFIHLADNFFIEIIFGDSGGISYISLDRGEKNRRDGENNIPLTDVYVRMGKNKTETKFVNFFLSIPQVKQHQEGLRTELNRKKEDDKKVNNQTVDDIRTKLSLENGTDNLSGVSLEMSKKLSPIELMSMLDDVGNFQDISPSESNLIDLLR